MAMESLYQEVRELIFHLDFPKVDDLLGDFDAWSFPPIVGVGLLRASFSVRDLLLNWTPLREEVKVWILEKNESLTLLRGLL